MVTMEMLGRQHPAVQHLGDQEDQVTLVLPMELVEQEETVVIHLTIMVIRGTTVGMERSLFI
jgi:hypothetical protein